MNKLQDKEKVQKRNKSPKYERAKFLQKQINELQKLCDELDPYSEICAEHKKVLNKYGIADLNDPFSLTNRLILMLEDSIEELEKIK